MIYYGAMSFFVLLEDSNMTQLANLDEKLLNNSKKVEIEYSKPCREYVYQFAKGELKITGSTMDLLMYISPFVDMDGLITISLDEARRDLMMQYKTFYNSLEEARQKGFLYRQNGEYYSRFHIPVGKENKGLKYQKLVQEYMSPSVLSYSLNVKRLFYYFASFTKMGTPKKVTIENLYKNKLHTNEFGVSYFDTFADLAKAMLTLIKNDQIRIQLLIDEDSNTGPILSADTEDLENTFYSYFGSLNGRKERTSCLKLEKHKIKVEMTERVVNNEVQVIATENEFKNISNTLDICWENLKRDTKNYIFSYKNELFDLFGETGLSIYRKSIQRYLKENHETILEHEKENKVANYIMDFYILNEIKNILLGAALHENVMIGNKKVSHLLTNGYLIDTTMIPKLLQFYLKRGSANHIVQLDTILNTHKIKYIEFEITPQSWKNLKEDVHAIYSEYFIMFSDKLTFPKWKKIVQDWASRGILSQKKSLSSSIKELYAELNYTSKYKIKCFSSNADQEQTRTQSIPIYNWLEK
jgi:hypothetical protein